MKKKIYFLFILIFTIFINSRVYAYDYSKSCYKESVEQLAKILFNETGCTYPNNEDNNFFVNAAVAAVAINNANRDIQTNNMSSKSNWDKKIYYLINRVYAGHSGYRDKSVESSANSHGCKKRMGQMYYISALALSGKFTFPTNMTGQAASYLASSYCDPPGGWHIFDTAPDNTEICYEKGLPKTGKDVFDNEIKDDSFEHYKSLAKSLMKNDYSEYTADNVCSKVANISGNGGNDTDSKHANKCIVNVNVPACENPDFVKVIFFAKLIFNVLKIVVPIGLIIMGMLDFSKSVTSNDENAQKKNLTLFIKRIIYAVLIFIVPWIVEVLIVNLGNLTEGVNFTDCLENADKKKIKELEENYEDLKEEYKQNNCSDLDTDNDSNKNTEKNGNDNKDGKKNNKKLNNTIYVGDSRTVGMFDCQAKKSNETVIAEGSMGYDWLVSTADSSIKDNIQKVGDSYIAINMGTNSGLTESEAGKYANYYNGLTSKYPNSQVVAISVTQIDVGTAKANGMYAGMSITNDSVKNFNKYLKSKLNSNVLYCDVYSKIKDSYKTLDGVHHDCNTYKDIYDAINDCLK